MVRHHHRNRLRRAPAIQHLATIVGEAFTSSDNYEFLLAAVLDGPDPHTYEQRF